ncbi:phytanoyl-CoA dioxygenase family protein [Kribbella sp. NBC_00709]|uniref:phytanoyl-CoA dioxygenase family protein n=1 Tax=Kribbella sp. NBC_00709 TaxID=2975972 RepID=UPI002E29E5F6|nr:phytanoyl-CoA dioxygenase family protein [Kribbella sp. NBC_00709]
MPEISDAQREQFREQGYVVVPGVLTDEQLATGRRIVATMLERKPPEGVGAHFLWPRFGADGHPLLDFYRAVGLAELAGQLLRPELAVQDPDFAQVATTIPPWPHRPGGPHVDGITPGLDDGTPATFSMLAGLWLTGHDEPDRGNLYIWPGTHLRLGAYLAEHGADALARVDEMNPGPYPDVPLGAPIQASGPAGSVLFAHYLLAHNIGGHSGTADDVRRETLYYRLQATGHRERWREVVTDPLVEFRV